MRFSCLFICLAAGCTSTVTVVGKACDADHPCPNDTLCDRWPGESVGSCIEPACEANAGCPAGQVCEAGRCYAPCNDTSQCDPDEMCLDPGVCRAPSSCAAVDCAPGSCNDSGDQIHCECGTGFYADGLTCRPCVAEASFACDQGNVYWFDSCGNRGEVKETCTTGCTGDACVPVCTSHSRQGCDVVGSSVGVYWFDACGQREDLVQACAAGWRCVGSPLLGGASCVAPQLSAEELCVLRVVARTNESSLQCSVHPLLDAESWSPDNLGYRCRPTAREYAWGEKLLAAESAGRVSVDWEKAWDCLQQARAFRRNHPGWATQVDPAWQALRDGICADFVAGLVGLSGSCTEQWDCQAGLGCFSTDPTMPGTLRCQSRAGLGQTCGQTMECAAGMFCDLGVCVLQKPAGTVCGATVQCLSGFCDLTGNSTCVEPPALNEVCRTNAGCHAYDGDPTGCAGFARDCFYESSAGICAGHWSPKFECFACLADDPNALVGTYRPRRQQGALCATSTECLAGLFCGCPGGTSCASPTCLPQPTSGACTGGCDSALGYYCDPVTTTCQATVGAGGSCANTPGACGEGTQCLATQVCGYSCTRLEDCSAGEFCRLGTGCEPLPQDGCTSDAVCLAGEYCLRPSCQYTDSVACNADADCQWTSFCVQVSGGACVADLPVGAQCAEFGGNSCVTGSCVDDGQGVLRCAVSTSDRHGCGSTIAHSLDSVGSAFIFGAVFAGRRRRKVRSGSEETAGRG